MIKKTGLDYLFEKSTLGYKTTYALIRGHRKLLCAWCKKNLYYMGDKRIDKHLEKHE